MDQKVIDAQNHLAKCVVDELKYPNPSRLITLSMDLIELYTSYNKLDYTVRNICSYNLTIPMYREKYVKCYNNRSNVGNRLNKCIERVFEL